jgi:hypothetical protein
VNGWVIAEITLLEVNPLALASIGKWYTHRTPSLTHHTLTHTGGTSFVLPFLVPVSSSPQNKNNERLERATVTVRFAGIRQETIPYSISTPTPHTPTPRRRNVWTDGLWLCPRNRTTVKIPIFLLFGNSELLINFGSHLEWRWVIFVQRNGASTNHTAWPNVNVG